MLSLKIWRDQKLISIRVLLGRLESSKEFKAENKTDQDTDKQVIVETLKISVRDLNADDIAQRKLPKNTTGIVVTKISADSPFIFFIN